MTLLDTPNPLSIAVGGDVADDPFAVPGSRMLVVSASMGAGHDGAADEIARRAEASGCDVDRIDFLDLLPFGLGRFMRAAYRLQLLVMPTTWGWMLTTVSRPGIHGRVARLSARLARRRLVKALGSATTQVLSTYPLASQALSALRLSGQWPHPVTTFLTDMSVHDLWVAPGIDRHLALHDVAANQARRLGANDIHVVGPMVSPLFCTTRDQRLAARHEMGVADERPLALVVAGSWGVGDVSLTVADLVTTGLVTPVVICGTNRRLLREMKQRADTIAVGWVDDMPRIMQACDVAIQNAGGLSMLEARQCALPVITYRSLPGHGATNAAALDQAGWATWVHDQTGLTDALQQALSVDLIDWRTSSAANVPLEPELVA